MLGLLSSGFKATASKITFWHHDGSERLFPYNDRGTSDMLSIRPSQAAFAPRHRSSVLHPISAPHLAVIRIVALRPLHAQKPRRHHACQDR